MDDFLKSKKDDRNDEENTNDLNNIFLNNKNSEESNKKFIDDDKIYFKFFKEKKTSRTYIYNLDKHLSEKEIKSIIKSIKQSLGTSCSYKETEFGMGYGFCGDFKKKIIDYLLTKNILSNDAFTARSILNETILEQKIF